MVAVPIRPPDRWKQLAVHNPPNGNGHAALVVTPRGGPVAVLAPLPIDAWRCACGGHERRQRPRWNDWVCHGCAVQVPSPEARP